MFQFRVIIRPILNDISLGTLSSSAQFLVSHSVYNSRRICFRKFCRFQSIHSQFFIYVYIYCMSQGRHVSASLI